MGELGLRGGGEVLARRAATVRLTIYAFLAAHAGVLVGSLLESAGVIDLYAEYPDELSGLFGIVYVLAFVVFVASVIAISMWIHRAHANLFAAGIEGLKYTPGWSVGWFFIPFANLVMPLLAMRELWTESRGMNWAPSDGTPAVLGAWWGTWLGGNILSGVGSRIAESGGIAAGGLLAAVAAGLLMLSAVLLLRIVREVTAAQNGGTIAAHAFA